MQSNHYPLIYKKAFLTAIKYLIAMACVYFIYTKLAASVWAWPVIDTQEFLPLILLVLMLMPLNWFLEIYRWKISVAFENITWSEAYRAVIRGLAMNWLIPFTAGDLGSRMAEVTNKKLSLVAVGFNRVIILLITLVYGGLSAVFYLGVGANPFLLGILIFLAIGFVTFLIVQKRIFGISSKFITIGLASKVALITLTRYLVFTFQFYLLIRFFNPDLPSSVILLGIGWVFLFRSVVPSVLGNIGVREASAFVFFQSYVVDLNLILFPCLLIWIINTIIPSILGLIPIINFRIKLAQ